MFKDSLPAKDIKIKFILDGDYTRLTFTVKAQTILVRCIYAPNNDMTSNDMNNYSNTFWKTVFDDSDDHNYDIQLMVGDFNVAPIHAKDTAGYLHINNKNSRSIFGKNHTFEQPI